ncbi:MAG: glycoside hydrolase family 3 C-terminal domain-containing protein [Lachnospiraceae bacterium]|nr:glycoside hydrolase family 3 C-terminal domain-containing protein [Lachnospiraceae bacterium]
MDNTSKKIILDWDKYIETARKAAAEGAVLLKNDNETLPLAKGSRVALFGRTQFDYIKSGTGSGGLVNVPYVVNYYDGIKACENLSIYEELSEVYREWIKENPFDLGGGWAQEPSCQVEMEVSDELVRKAHDNADAAVIFISRLSGEDKDRSAGKGDYLLQDSEYVLIEKVSKTFDKTIVLINSGDIIDMNWVNELNPSAVLYVWQGGCEGGNAVADILSGKAAPSGHLTETAALSIEDYPSHENFGDPVRNYYKEDIYVGYRFFETFAKEKVLYPFGFGLTYTTFETTYSFSCDDKFSVGAFVTNTGKRTGKEVVQVYVEAPQGFLGKPARALAAFTKTNDIDAGENELVTLDFGLKEIASFDDTGMTGYKDAFVCEAGEYKFYAGNNARDAELIGSFMLAETVLIEETTKALYPKREFERMIPDGEKLSFGKVPVRDYSIEELIEEERKGLKEIAYTGDTGIKLSDVKEGKASMDNFIAQLTDEDMIIMSRGEGMSSRRVIPGTCAAYGGVTDKLQEMGVPAAACTDGPSGLRIDSGMMAMQGPNGSCLASTFDTKLVEELYAWMGVELLKVKIECLLGPGMNIKRHPLNGRNFEYFSEDPLVTGMMAKAQLLGMAKTNTTGCIKHYACNNQETARYRSDSVVSARAMREIYLRGYEIAVREGGATHIMTTYGSLNGYHTAGNFELNTLVLRKDWGFKGVAMTDWWAVVGTEEDADPKVQKTSLMIRSQNDLYMVTNSSENNDNNDDSYDGYKNGVFTRSELQRNSANILELVMNTPTYDRMMGNEITVEEINRPSVSEVMADVKFTHEVTDGSSFDAALLKMGKGSVNMIVMEFPEKGDYDMEFELAADGSSLSQISLAFSVNNTVMKVISKNGSEKEFTKESVLMGMGNSAERFLKITFSQAGLKMRNIRFVKRKEDSDINDR